jgi:hypothetical protein
MLFDESVIPPIFKSSEFHLQIFVVVMRVFAANDPINGIYKFFVALEFDPVFIVENVLFFDFNARPRLNEVNRKVDPVIFAIREEREHVENLEIDFVLKMGVHPCDDFFKVVAFFAVRNHAIIATPFRHSSHLCLLYSLPPNTSVRKWERVALTCAAP